MFKNTQQYISNKTNRSNERSTNAIKNIIASFGIKGVSIIVQLLLVPMTIHYVNSSQYGIWLTLSSIVAWFGFFDIGFGNGLRNRFAEAKAMGDYDKAKAYVSTTYICMGVIFTIIWFLFFGINFLLDWSKILNAPAQMTKELSVVALIVISFFCLQMVFRLINTVLIADQKPAKSAFLDTLGQVFALLVIFILIRTTQGSLIYLALALGFCPILVMLISHFWFYKKDYKQFKPKFSLFNKEIVRDIFSLGSKFFLIQISMIVIFQTNNIVISQLCGSEDVTVYNIAFKMFISLHMIFSIILNPFWSAFTDAHTKGEKDWMRKIKIKLEKILILFVIIALLFLIFSQFIYEIWVGNTVVIPFSISLCLCLFSLIQMKAGMNMILINGIGKIRLQLFMYILLSALYFPVVIFLGLQYSLLGIAIGNVLITFPHIIWSQIQLKKLINGTATGIWNQ